MAERSRRKRVYTDPYSTEYVRVYITPHPAKGKDLDLNSFLASLGKVLQEVGVVGVPHFKPYVLSNLHDITEGVLASYYLLKTQV
jgi:hypothetical protein